jgi:hypothetical protein
VQRQQEIYTTTRYLLPDNRAFLTAYRNIWMCSVRNTLCFKLKLISQLNKILFKSNKRLFQVLACRNSKWVKTDIVVILSFLLEF